MKQQESLHIAYDKYAKEKTQDAYTEFLFNFFMFARDKCVIHVPTEIDSTGMNYGLVNMTEGYYYVVCTSGDELCRCPEKSSIVVTLDKMVARMLRDNKVKGISVNPYSDFPCFIPQQYARQLLDLAGE